ncbi:putative C6 transcription factor [Phyllosticta citricarpa]|uniref:C6 transcription factor n=1 Tax=Phyllosticta citricarpa TaxID=55181 RepID=A0ABR1MJA2_9PEZI
MPRPKVLPENRQRAPQACLPCKSSKKRCDSQWPCASCVKRDCPGACVYQQSRKRRRTEASIQSDATPATATAVRITPREDSQEADVAFVDTSTHSTENQNADDYADSSTDHAGERRMSQTTHTSQSTPQAIRSRMLLSSKGEKMYIGDFASISFLHLLRQILKHQMGPSQFTENNRRNTMLEADMRHETIDNFEEDLEQRRILIDYFYIATSGILDLYSKEEVERILTGQSSEDEQAAVHLMIAIGGQCKGQSSLDLAYGFKYFELGQKVALKGMLEDPSLYMVKLFLLMGFYVLGACRRNTAFMYLGVASRAAWALGLHVEEQYEPLDLIQADRLRTWKSLRVIDLIVNAILGRPCALPVMDLTSIDSSQGHGKVSLDAIFEACCTIDKVARDLGSGRGLNPKSAECYLQQLEEWSNCLPNGLRKFTRSDSQGLTSNDRELIIGNIHVACVYYFAVILVTRPFLISHLTSHLSGQSPPEGTSTGTDKRLAQVCIDSAVYMAQMCAEALDSEALIANMCLLKAWIFAAGLVLGFSIFAQGEANFDIEDAFNEARKVLQFLARLSPQAEHYYEILSNFSEAIGKHRQQLAHQKRRVKKKYVSQIFTMETHDGPSSWSQPHHVDSVPADHPTGTASEAASVDPNLWDEETWASIQLPLDFDYGELATQITECFHRVDTRGVSHDFTPSNEHA